MSPAKKAATEPSTFASAATSGPAQASARRTISIVRAMSFAASHSSADRTHCVDAISSLPAPSA
jgi:hypothetical protein